MRSIFLCPEVRSCSTLKTSTHWRHGKLVVATFLIAITKSHLGRKGSFWLTAGDKGRGRHGKSSSHIATVRKQRAAATAQLCFYFYSVRDFSPWNGVSHIQTDLFFFIREN